MRGEESGNKNTGDKEERKTTDGGKTTAQKNLFGQEVEREVGRRMHALGVRGRSHVACSELAGAATERAGHRDHEMDNQREPPSSMGKPSRRAGGFI